MSEQRRVGRILTSEGWVSGALVHDTHVLAIEAGEEAGEDAGEDAPRISPGFVDLHVPGGGGADITLLLWPRMSSIVSAVSGLARGRSALASTSG